MKKILTFISALMILLLISGTLTAQNENDALRYSLINYGGTARFMGLSGAYGAVGADFSALSQNPAGLGLYRKSEFSITPVLSSNKTNTDFLSKSNSDSRTAIHLGNVGYVYAQNMNGHTGSLVQLNFGFGINMMSSFSNRMLLSGFNNNSSFLTSYVNDVNRTGDEPDNWNNYGSWLAYETYLINYDSTNQRWAAEMENGGIQQTKSVETHGSTNETVLSAAANISDKLFLGVTFAFPYIRYHEESRLTEEDTRDLGSDFNSFDRYEYLDTRGAGFNFKAGFIFIPVQFLRIGGSIHTPTNYYNMSDNYSASMNSTFDNGDHFSQKSDNSYFDYQLRTPLRATGSVAFILGQHGLISADYEYIDYSLASLHANDYNFSSENSTIRSDYTSANNFRLGAEFKAGIAAVRGGYNFYGSPYKDAGTVGSRNGFSAGLGLRNKVYFLDFAYNHTNSSVYYYLYGGSPSSDNQIKNNSYNLTLGFKF